MKVSNKQNKAQNETIPSLKIFFVTVAGFILLAIISFLNEILDIPHFLIGAPETPANWDEVIIETAIIVGVGIIFSFILFRRIKNVGIAERRLKESEAKYRTLVENAKDGIVIVQDGIFKFVNSAVAELTGYTSEEMVGVSFLNFIPKDSRDFMLERYKKRMSSKKVPSFYELELIRKDNKKVIVEINGNLIYYDNKPADLAIIRDITKRKQLENALKKSKERLRNFIESAVTPFLIWDSNFNLTDANKATLDLFPPGTKKKDIIGKNILEIVPTFKKREKYRRYLKAVETGEPVFGDEFVRCPGVGDKYLAVKAFKVDSNLGMIAVDITNRKLLEEKIEHSLEEKTIMLKEIHHRVKNNLQLISSLLNLHSAQIKDEKLRKIFDESKNRIYSIALIHERLYGSGDFSRIDFEDYIKNLSNLLYRTYGFDPKKIDFTVTVKNVSLGIDAAVPCGLILNELISNALQHAFPPSWQGKGKIEVLFHSLPRHEFELIVKDNGVGIPEDLDIRHTDSLGLHLVTLLAEGQLGGRLNLDRRNGTKFQIIFKAENYKNNYHGKE